MLVPVLTAVAVLVSVAVPVDDPVLPTGPLLAAGAAAEGSVFVDAPSFERSDIAGMIRGTTVIVSGEEAPLRVSLTWIDCNKRLYQLSSGRRYNAAGVEVEKTDWQRDTPIEAGSAYDRIAGAFCGKADWSALPVVADYRSATEKPAS
ncbi:MAG TPA: hypothetical protein VD906_07340 [Caulobacteraceae bacterium]|nr:hypothetical protein [Caulobacteraceae bacterium]